jgi:hypothetical protein
MLQGVCCEAVAGECLAEVRTEQQKICLLELMVDWMTRQWWQLHVLEGIL